MVSPPAGLGSHCRLEGRHRVLGRRIRHLAQRFTGGGILHREGRALGGVSPLTSDEQLLGGSLDNGFGMGVPHVTSFGSSVSPHPRTRLTPAAAPVAQLRRTAGPTHQHLDLLGDAPVRGVRCMGSSTSQAAGSVRPARIITPHSRSGSWTSSPRTNRVCPEATAEEPPRREHHQSRRIIPSGHDSADPRRGERGHHRVEVALEVDHHRHADNHPEVPEHTAERGHLLEQPRVRHPVHDRLLPPSADHGGVQQGEAHVRGHGPQASGQRARPSDHARLRHDRAMIEIESVPELDDAQPGPRRPTGPCATGRSRDSTSPAARTCCSGSMRRERCSWAAGSPSRRPTACARVVRSSSRRCRTCPSTPGAPTSTRRTSSTTGWLGYEAPPTHASMPGRVGATPGSAQERARQVAARQLDRRCARGVHPRPPHRRRDGRPCADPRPSRHTSPQPAWRTAWPPPG